MEISHSEKMAIRRRIIREFAAGDYFRSLVAVTLEMLLRDFPDETKEAAGIEVAKMADELILLKSPSPPFVYRLNPNKYNEIQAIRHSALEVMQPHEDSIPEGFPRNPTFVRKGAKDSKGVVGKYFYYERGSDGYWLCYVITGPNAAKDKIDMGSLNDRQSDLFQVSDAIQNKLKKPKFFKADLDTLVDHRIVQNRQPIKAAIDILEYLKYIRKTGFKRGKSEEYERTHRRPPEPGLEKFFRGGK